MQSRSTDSTMSRNSTR